MCMNFLYVSSYKHGDCKTLELYQEDLMFSISTSGNYAQK